MNKDFVRIQSSKTIQVTMGLQNKDVTNPDAHVADRLKVSPLWPKTKVLIRAGVGNYPAIIQSWPSVQALVSDGILTISESASAVSEDEAKINIDLTAELGAINEVDTTTKKRGKRQSLLEAAADESGEQSDNE